MKIRSLLIVCSGAIILALTVCEALIRLSGLWVVVDFQARSYFAPSQLPDIPYLLKPNLRTRWAGGEICTNSEGLRNCSDYAKDHPHSKRVLIVGDSLVFGYGVGQHQTITAHLQRLLSTEAVREEWKSIEVINAGIEGFSAVNEAALLERLLDRYAPDAIIWLLIPNDWDDPLAVTAEGTMTTDTGSYSATAQWLNMTWGVGGNCVHYRNIFEDMGPVQQAWALEQPIPEQTSKNFLARNSYLYALISSRLRQTTTSKTSYSGDCYPNRKETGISDWPILPQIDAIYLSPRFSARFDGSIRRAVSAATAHKTPLVILGMDIPLKRDVVGEGDTAGIDDIVAYLGMDFDTFRSRYNLGWDPHFTSSGNELLARAMFSALVRHKLIDAESGAGILPFRSRDAYWKLYESWRQELIESLMFPEMDFENFRNMHQLVGGLYPPRTFPIKPGGTVSLLLKGETSSSRLTVRGVNQSQQPQLLGYEIAGQQRGVLSLSPGIFEEVLNLDPRQQDGTDLIDIQLSCGQERCENIKLHFVGLS